MDLYRCGGLELGISLGIAAEQWVEVDSRAIVEPGESGQVAPDSATKIEQPLASREQLGFVLSQ